MRPDLSSTKRPLRMRARRDLQAVAVETADMSTWILKDPLTLEHFHLSAEEYFLWESLKKPANIDEMKRTFDRRFAPQTISEDALWEFVNRLYRSGLLMSQAPGQGTELLEENQRDTWRRLAMACTQLLAIRFRGINPDAWLGRLHAAVSWLFSLTALCLVAALVIYAGSLVFGHFDKFVSRLPSIHALLDVRNLIWILVAIGVVKVLHELGHALTCKHFGGEVHELGLMLLAFAPCLYCDVSDVWKLPNRWQRIAVSAAGMVVEIVIASLATIVWWYSQPGLVNLLAMNLMIVCSVNTLMVNGNPLLRFDGYYLLSDLADTPNLWQRSREVLRSAWSRWALGLDEPDDPLLPKRSRLWLGAYGLASTVYLTFVLVSIVWVMVQTLRPYHLETLAYGVGLVAVGVMATSPVVGAVGLVKNPMRRSEINRRRLFATSSLLLAGLVVVLAWPVTYYVRAPMVLMPTGATHVYATVGGRLVENTVPGEAVEAGSTLALMEDADIQREIVRLEGEVELQNLRLEHLKSMRGRDREAGDQIPAARAVLEDFSRQLQDRLTDAERLKVVAPVGGTVIAPPRMPAQDAAQGKLPTWSGSLLEASNQGAWVEPGTLVCLVGDTQQLSAVLLVDDADVQRVARGQEVRVAPVGLPGQVVDGSVVEVARGSIPRAHDAESIHSQMDRLFFDVVPPGARTHRFQVTVQLEPTDVPLVTGGRGVAKIATERITFGRQILRTLLRIFQAPT